MAEPVRPSDHGEQPVGDPVAFTMDEVELGFVGKAKVPRKATARDRGGGG